MTEQQHHPDADFFITDAWQLPSSRGETVSAFITRALDSRDWFAGDTLVIAGEHGAPVLASGDAVDDGDLVTLADDAARTILLLTRRLLDFGFGRITFRLGEDGVMRLVEVQLQLRPRMPGAQLQAFLDGLKTDVLPRIKAAYGAWWLPGTKRLRVRYDRGGTVESGCLTLSI
jgi:hypothetical protein